MDSIFSELEPAGTGTSRDFWPAPDMFSSPRTMGTEFEQECGARLRAAQNQTMDLDAAFFEDYGTVLNLSSRNAFVCFMRYNRVSQPLLGADSSGILEATWQRGQECLSIRFEDRHHLSYAISYLEANGSRRRRWAESSLATFLSDCPEGKRLTSS